MHIKVWDAEQIEVTGLPAIQIGHGMYDSMELMTRDTPVAVIRKYSPPVIILQRPGLSQIEVLTREGYEPPVLDDVMTQMELNSLDHVQFPRMPLLLAFINLMGSGKFRKEEFSLFLSEQEFNTLLAARWILQHGSDSYSVSLKLVELYHQDAEDLLADKQADEIENGSMFNVQAG